VTAISPGRAGEELWRFSLAVYAAPGVAPHCLDLQDKCGADVNVVLALAWAGASGRGTIVTADLVALDRAVAPLRRAVVEPLRAARRWLRPMIAADRDPGDLDDLRTRIKAVELEAERRVQARLGAALDVRRVVDPPEARLAAAASNVEAYLRHLGAACSPGPLIPAMEAWIREHS
jgi:uncharacterized protein (TIGR02444 family)